MSNAAARTLMPVPMDKAAIVALILAQLDAELERSARAARDAQAGATDEQSKPEHKYDTRGLEASYLAHGQSRQALETAHARRQLGALVPRDFLPGEPIEIGALVVLGGNGQEAWYLVAPAGGGREVLFGPERTEVTVITPAAPLGGQLLGKREGERVGSLRIMAVR